MGEETIKYPPGAIPLPYPQPKPLTLMEKFMIGLPAMVLGLVLALVVSYFLVSTTNDGTKKEVTAAYKKAIETESTQTADEFKRVNADNAKLQQELAAVNKRADQIEKEKVVVTEQLTKIATGLTQMTGDFDSFKTGQENVDRTQNQDIAKNEKAINEVERKVKYIDDRLKRLDELAADVNGLKNDTTGLKQQFSDLKSFTTELHNRQNVTDKELADLDQRSRTFQLRVLAARAREAADAARQSDLKTLLKRLDDVEDTK